MKKLRDLHKKIKGRDHTRAWLADTYCDDKYLYSSDGHRMIITKKFRGSEKLFPVNDVKKVNRFKDVYPIQETEKVKRIELDVPFVKFVYNSINDLPVSLNLKLMSEQQLRIGGPEGKPSDYLTFNLALLDAFCGESLSLFYVRQNTGLVIVERKYKNKKDYGLKTFQDFLDSGHEWVYVLMPMRTVRRKVVTVEELKDDW